MPDKPLRSQLIRLASELEPGDPVRKELLAVLKEGGPSPADSRDKEVRLLRGFTPAEPGSLAVGDILYNRYGSLATPPSHASSSFFYQVVRVAPKTVTVRPLEPKSQGGAVSPLSGKFAGPPFKKRLVVMGAEDTPGIMFSNGASAGLWDGRSKRIPKRLRRY